MIQSLPLPPAALRAQIASHLPWAQFGDWTPLFGGRTNSAWQVAAQDGSQAAVLKLYRAPAQNPLFPNDPIAEANLLQHLDGCAIAPKLIAQVSGAHGHGNLYQAVPGNRWVKGVQDVAKLMQQLHAIAPPKGLRPIANGSAALLAQADAIVDKCQHTDRLRVHRPAVTVAPNSHQVLLHCDIVPGNLISNGQGLHLIDWQCPGVGDPCEDLAIFLSPAMQILYRGTALSAAETVNFLQEFPEDSSIRYRMLSPCYHYRMAAYCLWQSQNNRPDYAEGYAAELAQLTAL
ncbi:MAG: aminoglycoside phosphotransferase family protein [Cognatishimia sp.]